MKIYEIAVAGNGLDTVKKRVEDKAKTLRQSREPDDQAQAKALLNLLAASPRPNMTVDDYMRMSAQMIHAAKTPGAPASSALSVDSRTSRGKPSSIKRSVSKGKKAFNIGTEIGNKITRGLTTKRQPKHRSF